MIIVFTDGSSRGNPGPGGWGAIVAKEDVVMELGGREDKTTNNRMELSAVISALQSVSSGKPARPLESTRSGAGEEITIYTDSAYVINGITRWVKGWEKNDWKTSTKEDVLNKDLWESLVDVSSHKIIHWKLLKGHSGNHGNERCDAIATSFADKNPVTLYNGSSERYGVDLSVKKSLPAQAGKSKSKAYSYVSMVEGEIKVHKTWEECKARVNGVANAKYKKSTSPANEEEIIGEFAE